MASYNKVILLGNLTRDPELRYTNSGTAVCEFGLAVNRRVGNDPNKDEVCFVDIVVWDKQAESTGRILQKGAPALIEGRLQLDQWQDRESGQKRSRLRVVAERVQFIGARQEREEFDGGDMAPPPQQQQNYAPRQSQPPQNQYPQQQQQRGYQSQGGGGYQKQGGYQQQQGGGYQQPRQQQSSYQPPQAPQQQGGYQQDPPMPSPDAFDVGMDGAEDDIPF